MTPKKPAKGPNEKALHKTLAALGHPMDSDAARYQLLRSLAAAVDLRPDRAGLWSEYREALADLTKDTNDADRSLDEAREALDRAAKVGNP